MMDISVIVCCYNGVRRLRPTIEHLARQKCSATLSWELVFVDNASTDGSADFVRQFAISEPFQRINASTLI